MARALSVYLSLSALCVGTVHAQTAGTAPPATSNWVVNGGFEAGMAAWSALWTRDAGVGTAMPDAADRRAGTQSVRIVHAGTQDWSLAQSVSLQVKPGDFFEFSAWVRVRGAGDATLGVITRDAAGTVLNWVHGGRTTRETGNWRALRGRFVIPLTAATIQCRLTGGGPASVWLDDVVLTRHGNVYELLTASLPATLSMSNDAIEVTLDTAHATLNVRDRRVDRRREQRAEENTLAVLSATNAADRISLRLLDAASMREISATVRLDGQRPECVVTIVGDGDMEAPLGWPAPFAPVKGEMLILPVNEGIAYPVDDASLPPMHYHLYGGHGLCMPWYGATDGGAGWMAIVETPDDAAVRIPRRGELLRLEPEWQPQKGRFGPPRTLRYAFFDRGGHVAMAKRYREHARATGLFKTLADKRKAIPAVDLLIGAVNVWCWDRDAPAICREMQSLGIERILWSNQRPPEELKALNDMGVLTSRYDIYQDAMDPANFARLRWTHPDWTGAAWSNDDLTIGPDGAWERGWEVETRDGPMIPCGVLCDRQAPTYARQRVPPELATHPYRCRFIDTTTASPWRECYHPKHPMTRSESKRFKMELLQYIGDGCGLVCGSETGHDAAVPFVHYFEGMLSLGPYRVPDAGRNMMQTIEDVPERVARFQTGHAYRLPLWELVYHDCVVAQWYWGDYNNKLPRLWDRRDLWNALYGTPPMFMFSRASWAAQRDRFAQSYATAAPVARATGYAEMLSHEWLTPDHAVQHTRFANGVAVTVNFGDTPWTADDGRSLPPLGRRVEGMAAD